MLAEESLNPRYNVRKKQRSDKQRGASGNSNCNCNFQSAADVKIRIDKSRCSIEEKLSGRRVFDLGFHLRSVGQDRQAF